MNVFKGIRAILPTVLKEDASGHRQPYIHSLDYQTHLGDSGSNCENEA